MEHDTRIPWGEIEPQAAAAGRPGAVAGWPGATETSAGLSQGRELHAPWVWVNGGFARSEDLRVHYFTHALHYGSGVFEGIRGYDTGSHVVVFRLRDHVERLLRSARLYRMAVPYGADDLCAAALETVRRNGLRDAYLRPLCFYGEGPVRLDPSACPTEVLIAVRPPGAHLGDDALARGARLTLSSWHKFDRSMLPASAKGCGQYTNSILAVQEARARGADEAILLNPDGTVAEATGENVFFVRDGTVATNDETSNILPGITRDTVLALARDLGLRTEIRTFDPEDLFSADEVFLTGTAAEVTPVAAIDGHSFPAAPGPVTARLQQAYVRCVRGRDLRYARWLSHV